MINRVKNVIRQMGLLPTRPSWSTLRNCISILFVVSLSLLETPCNAQTLEPVRIPSSWNPVGSGARALGMGGAFIAVADDATAASWNPGGLVQLEKPEISAVGFYTDRDEGIHFGTNPEGSGEHTATIHDLNFLSIAYPFSFLNHEMIVALNYQKLFDFNRNWSFSLVLGEGFLSQNRKTNVHQNGELGAFGFAYGIRLSPNFSFGFTLNFWEDWFGGNEWDEKTDQTISSFLETVNIHEKKKNSFSGFNANLGVQWNATPNFTIGAVLKTPFTADLNVTTDRQITFDSDQPISQHLFEANELDMPMSYGIGLGYRFSDEFTVAGDVYRTEWQDFLLKRSNGKTSPITGFSKSESDIDATTQARLGFEYLSIKPSYVIPLRGGIFYDPAPATGSPDDIYGITIGSGYARDRIIFDLAYQYRWGKDIGASAAELKPLDFSYDLKEHAIYYSLIVHF